MDETKIKNEWQKICENASPELIYGGFEHAATEAFRDHGGSLKAYANLIAIALLEWHPYGLWKRGDLPRGIKYEDVLKVLEDNGYTIEKTRAESTRIFCWEIPGEEIAQIRTEIPDGFIDFNELYAGNEPCDLNEILTMIKKGQVIPECKLRNLKLEIIRAYARARKDNAKE